jgi:hypothetical protein
MENVSQPIAWKDGDKENDSDCTQAQSEFGDEDDVRPISSVILIIDENVDRFVAISRRWNR